MPEKGRVAAMNTPKNSANDLMNLIGALAEMAHHFYISMINSGASASEASVGMQSFIAAWWQDMMNAARKENKAKYEEEQEQE